MILTNTRFRRRPSNSKASRHGCAQDLFPGAKLQAAVSDRHHHFAAHDLPFHMRVGVIFLGAIVTVLADRLVWSQFFQPVVVILVQAALVVVDEHTCCDMLRVYKGQHIYAHIPHSFNFRSKPL
jgi:hypothetical protein